MTLAQRQKLLEISERYIPEPTQKYDESTSGTMSSLDMLGRCPSCGVMVLDSAWYKYKKQADQYWHVACLPKNNIGYE
jgi:hypothetical protein